MPRKPLIAANWKMHWMPAGATEPGSPYRAIEGVDVVVFPTIADIPACVQAGLTCGGQWGHPSDAGARTGDVSMAMLAKLGCTYVLCGHSERREHHHETDEFVAEQVAAALKQGLTPILCIGETAEQRAKKETEAVLQRQAQGVWHHLEANLKLETRNLKLIVAYEPVWAISGGDPTKPAASPDDAQKAHAFIRTLLPSKNIPILYGGSMNAKNAADLLRQGDVDGGLVGGASLKPEDFRAIVAAARNIP